MVLKKEKTHFVCQACGTIFSKWQGRCSACNEWNSIVEEVVLNVKNKSGVEKNKEISKPLTISQINIDDTHRHILNGVEMNRVLGGGLVPGSVTLLAGEPGVGKSTLLLDMALNYKDGKVLYVSGEESASQIKMRAERISVNNDSCFVFCETNVETILHHIEKIKPVIVVIDSVQTLFTNLLDTSPGSVAQIRESTSKLQQYAKSINCSVFLIGHVTKEGYIAGPKLLEHMVDTVLNLEGEKHYGFRILRSVKNRFGSTAELGIFEMIQSGLREIIDPSEIFISQHDDILSGICIGSVIEGIRPLLVEVQALVGTSPYGQPQRSSTGFDAKRMSMFLAILEKKLELKLGNKDVFLNITGGVKVADTSMDLSVILSIVSSYLDIPIERNICFAGEVGLSGEIRPVSRLEQRINEAEKRSYKKIIVSKFNYKSDDFKQKSIEVVPVGKIEDVFRLLFRKHNTTDAQ